MNEINAIVTGSRKYGTARKYSDTDVVLFCSKDTYEDIWAEALPTNGVVTKCLFDQVRFTQHDRLRATMTFDPDEVVCVMSEADQELLGGLEHWFQTKHGGYRSTGRNNEVNIVPVHDPERWALWKEGTAALFDMKQAGESIEREFCIDYFTMLGMPRFQS